MWTGAVLWLFKGLAYTTAAVGLYAAVAHHHYARGWAAHRAEVEVEIAVKNSEIDRLNGRISHQMLVAGIARQKAVDDAISSERQARAAEPATAPVCAPVPAPAAKPVRAASCGIAPATRAKLNLLK